MTRYPSILEKLKRLVRGIALWQFVRLSAEPEKSDDEIKRFTELIARHDALLLVELPIHHAMISLEIAAMKHVAEMKVFQAQRKLAEENAKVHAMLAGLSLPNDGR